MESPNPQLLQVFTKAGRLPDNSTPPSWAVRPSPPLRAVAELAAICAAYFLIRFIALPTFWLYHATLSSLWQTTVVVPWTYIKTVHRFSSDGSNTLHSAIGRECYRIQSQVLGISDWWGVFDADPSLHAHQGGVVVCMFYYTLIISLFIWGPAFRMDRRIGCSLPVALSKGVYMTFLFHSLPWGMFWLLSTDARWKRSESQVKEHLG